MHVDFTKQYSERFSFFHSFLKLHDVGIVLFFLTILGKNPYSSQFLLFVTNKL